MNDTVITPGTMPEQLDGESTGAWQQRVGEWIAGAITEQEYRRRAQVSNAVMAGRIDFRNAQVYGAIPVNQLAVIAGGLVVIGLAWLITRR